MSILAAFFILILSPFAVAAGLRGGVWITKLMFRRLP